MHIEEKKIKNKQYNIANRESRRAYQREYYLNKCRREISEDYQLQRAPKIAQNIDLPAKTKEYKQEYYRRNREKILEKMRKGNKKQNEGN